MNDWQRAGQGALGDAGGGYLSSIGGLGGLGSSLGSLFGDIMGNSQWQDPGAAGMQYLNQISPMMQQYLSPYINAGMGQLPGLQQQYGNLMNDPGGVMSKMGAGYQQSPGYQWQVNQATGAANRAAAAGGMLGSPQEQQNLAGTVNNLANQDYYNYLSRVMGLYGTGLEGAQGLYNTGAGTAENLSTNLGNAMQSQAMMQYAGTQAKNQQNQGFWSGIGNVLGSLI